MNARVCKPSGFTLIEIMVGLAIVAVLAAIAVVGYQKYVERAQGTDIVVRYDTIRTGVATKIQTARADDCAELAKGLDTGGLASGGATLGYGFEAVTGGYRPVLTVCAEAGKGGPQGVRAARGAYETLEKNGMAEKNPVITDSVVSFALRLTDGDAALCKTAPTQASATCGQSQQAVQAPVQPVQPPAQSAQPAQPAASTPACEDTYGSTCDVDFGLHLCGDDFVRDICQKFCGVCGSPSGAAQAAAPTSPPKPVPAPMVQGSTPQAPQVPASAGTPRIGSYRTGVASDIWAQSFLFIYKATSPDGSPVRVTKIELPPGSGTADITGRGDIKLTPGAPGDYTMYVTLTNASGTLRVPATFSVGN